MPAGPPKANSYSYSLNPPAGIRNILFSGMQVRSRRGNYLAGSQIIPVRGITFRDVDFTVTGDLKDTTAAIPDPLDIFGAADIPHAFYVRYAADIAFRDCRIRWDGAQDGWLSGLHVVDGRGIDCRALRVEPLHKTWTSGITSERSEILAPPGGNT